MERTYTIPLRREWIKTVRYKRAKKTIRAIREFMEQHMKATDVKIGKHLNEEVWKHGIANPPSRVRVNCVKDKDGIVTVELFGKPIGSKAEAPKEPTKKDTVKKTAKTDKAAPEKAETKDDSKATEKKPEVKEAPAAKKDEAPKKAVSDKKESNAPETKKPADDKSASKKQ